MDYNTISLNYIFHIYIEIESHFVAGEQRICYSRRMHNESNQQNTLCELSK